MCMFWIVQSAVPKILCIKNSADQNQSCPADFGIPHFFLDVGQCTVNKLLIRPGNSIGDHSRTITAVMRNQYILYMFEVSHRQMNGQGGADGTKFCKFLTFGHSRGMHGRTCGNNGLAYFRQVQFLF